LKIIRHWLTAVFVSSAMAIMQIMFLIGFHLFTADYRVKVACKVDTACSPSITTPYLSNYKRCLRLPDMHYLPSLFCMQMMEFTISLKVLLLVHYWMHARGCICM